MIVDTTIQYDCPYDRQPHNLVVWNPLYIPSMSYSSFFAVSSWGTDMQHAKDPS